MWWLKSRPTWVGSNKCKMSEHWGDSIEYNRNFYILEVKHAFRFYWMRLTLLLMDIENKYTRIITALSDWPSSCDINQELSWQLQHIGKTLHRYGNLIFLLLHLSWVRTVDYGVLFFVVTLTVPLLWTEDFLSKIVKTAVSMSMKCKWKMLKNF